MQTGDASPANTLDGDNYIGVNAYGDDNPSIFVLLSLFIFIFKFIFILSFVNEHPTRFRIRVNGTARSEGYTTAPIGSEKKTLRKSKYMWFVHVNGQNSMPLILLTSIFS